MRLDAAEFMSIMRMGVGEEGGREHGLALKKTRHSQGPVAIHLYGIRGSPLALGVLLLLLATLLVACTRPKATPTPTPPVFPLSPTSLGTAPIPSAVPPTSAATPASSPIATATPVPPPPTPTPDPGATQWFVRWEDPQEKAFSLLLPQGWTASGGTVRVNTSPAFEFEATSGDAKVWIEWAVPVMFWEPNDYTRFLGYAEGSQVTDYGFQFTILRYYPSRQFITELWLGSVRQEHPDTTIGSVQDAPEVAQAYADPIATESSAATAIATFTQGGKAMKAGVTVLTERMVMGPGYGLWAVKDLGASAPQDAFNQAASLFSLMLSSFRLNPQWVQAEIAGQQQRAEIIRSTFQRIRDMDYRMFQEEQASRMRIAQGWMDALGGSRALIDPSTGQSYSIPNSSGMDYAWADRAGNVAITELDASPGMGFTRLELPR